MAEWAAVAELSTASSVSSVLSAPALVDPVGVCRLFDKSSTSRAAPESVAKSGPNGIVGDGRSVGNCPRPIELNPALTTLPKPSGETVRRTVVEPLTSGVVAIEVGNSDALSSAVGAAAWGKLRLLRRGGVSTEGTVVELAVLVPADPSVGLKP
ncbi:hypothetical protein ACQ856_04860 [Mycolicibacterium psychrotolerans]|uniref:hypothetical protein n=1 Tax=Mycolicibacterium psychrotolerans TaxID=216929 RepID=UPI003D67C8A8